MMSNSKQKAVRIINFSKMVLLRHRFDKITFKCFQYMHEIPYLVPQVYKWLVGYTVKTKFLYIFRYIQSLYAYKFFFSSPNFIIVIYITFIHERVYTSIK